MIKYFSDSTEKQKAHSDSDSDSDSDTDRRTRKKGRGGTAVRRVVCVCVSRGVVGGCGDDKKIPNTDRGNGDTTRRPLSRPVMEPPFGPLFSCEISEWKHYCGAAFCRPHSQTLLGSTAR